ncbi:ABC-type multidrug transport system, ATPase component [Gulbenkiania indica]|uniref:ABC-type multidrug transport system, ATPase component n=1 Tax=Gulbenkiania indica TaxID=375574 RepID=A0A0K6H1R3_9NEIS|nr:ATP-binding cassette domain-containing protein [Gulbenkiania indica]CUA84679.1 ABC-type multidrug transport system, ATPase component [Gulbenkiania indica]
MSEIAIAAEGFVKRYTRHEAVRGLDLQVRRGELYGLIGPDGAGKSSFMKAVAGVLAYEAGRLTVFGHSIDSERSAEAIKGRLGLMPQGLGQNLYGDLSIEENIDFFARLRLVPRDEAAERKERLLRMTRLDAFRDRPMKKLSGGMKQKLGLVCTLIHAPELIVLDEPTTGVDPVSRRDFWSILAELIAEQGLTALVSTAYMDEASRFSRMSLMHEGRVLAEGTPDDILGRAPGTIVECEASPQVEAMKRLGARFEQVEAMGTTLRLFVPESDEASARSEVKAALEGCEINSLETHEPELEDVFVALLGKETGEASADTPRPQALDAESASSEPVHSTSEGVDSQQRLAEDGSVATERDQPAYAIEAQGLTKRFGDFVAVGDVSFRVRPGEIFGLLGANGAGKTTAIKMLTGILPPSGGEGRVAGADMRRAGSLIKTRIGYMSQAFSLYLDLTVVENIRLYAGLYGLSRSERDQRLAWIIDMAGLHGHETDLAATLPMGLRQRLALGCALVHRPRVLFLDEPTSGVDPLGRRAFWEILFRLSRVDGVAMLVTTHYMSEAEHCDHLALMFAGKVVADASPAEMKRQVTEEAGALYEVAADQAASLVRPLREAGFASVSPYGRKLHVLTREPEKLAEVLKKAGAAARVTPRAMAMEDVFVHKVSQLEAENRKESA